MADLGEAPVYIDITRLVHRMRKGRIPTGVDRVCLAYVGHFHGRAQAMMIHNGVAVALSVITSMTLFDTLQAWAHGQRHGSLAKTVGHMLKLPIRPVKSGSWVLNMGHSGLDRPSYLAWLRRKKMRLLVMAHDLIPVTHPHFCQSDATQRHGKRLQVILGQSAGIVSNSQHTAEALRDYAENIKMSIPPMAVIPLGTHLKHGPLNSPEVAPARPYFVTVGTLEPRKNHAFLLYLWQRMMAEWRWNHIPQLRIIGQVGWMCGDVLYELQHNERLKEHVEFLPHCSDAEVLAHLRGAQALLFPSHAEGFGLPLLEALESGVPVLANPLPVFAEIAGNIPEYLDTDDEAVWLQAIRDFSECDHERRQQQLQRIKGFVAPTWPEHFEKFEKFVSLL
ncbi:glycosyltransferase family 4 protein [Acidithiobacillus thiooxidans]|uniref:glycosyltransferase family 4 protein n=1 Tax=Acidithiobacillus TaxID=119977 RepID=UPI00187AE474|nr:MULTISPECIES: glycosyltransferase family 1 protein [Acidithiobacillus]MBE7565893.1 glycosyltransferase family 4 protein [Acidithiobacillus sp. HP-11]MBU2751739.1 glycosyltransferase family 4 protein [Acidithiobacillus thiooxidans]